MCARVCAVCLGMLGGLVDAFNFSLSVSSSLTPESPFPSSLSPYYGYVSSGLIAGLLACYSSRLNLSV